MFNSASVYEQLLGCYGIHHKTIVFYTLREFTNNYNSLYFANLVSTSVQLYSIIELNFETRLRCLFEHVNLNWMWLSL